MGRTVIPLLLGYFGDLQAEDASASMMPRQKREHYLKHPVQMLMDYRSRPLHLLSILSRAALRRKPSSSDYTR